MSVPIPVAATGKRRRDTESGGLSDLLEQRALTAHFQPIVQLRAARVFGHESLVRGPSQSPLAMPEALFEAARGANLVGPLEIECARVALVAWAQRQAAGKLFVNFSASALASALSDGRLEASMDFLADCGVAADSLVVELTEHEQIADIDRLRGIVDLLRLRGVQVALDDFGDGRSSLRLWSELKPEYLKIDKYFSHGVAEHADKLQMFRAVQQIAETFGTELVAEGIETAADLRVLRDLGVHYGQGWFLGRPQAEPIAEPLPPALEVLRSRTLAVLPEMRTAASRRITAAQLLVRTPTVGPTTTNDELYRMIACDEAPHAVAVLQDDVPLALIDCQQFINRYARPFFRELYGRRSCLMFANRQPLLVELNTAMEDLTPVLTAGDQRYLREGFIVTEHGRYRGLGTGQALVKAVTEARVEAARHANPLTFLPGNIPISQHIERLLAGDADFAAAYVDLNHFKPYNDHYGYWRGDEMIRVAAALITAHVDPLHDFVGHIGGDDFIVVFQSGDWQARCDRIVREFNARAPELFDPGARAAGGIIAEDRHGEMRFHACTTLRIGVAYVVAGAYRSAEEVSSAAAVAKRLAKREAGGCYVVRRRAA
jgi:EAL domain-containing protein (putative c-di-GMP-specific phosphodiesterase class I)/GGDEF domain-containing protein